mmetsp:Transcript_12300/g.26864  ORF Transcript_12300/g.26864 Transcript_12300/m.26864 type:complete len:141 (+) Transcript_12300:2848-3270(+)
MEASRELSTRSNTASSLFLKLRFQERHSPFPSTLVIVLSTTLVLLLFPLAMPISDGGRFGRRCIVGMGVVCLVSVLIDVLLERDGGICKYKWSVHRYNCQQIGVIGTVLQTYKRVWQILACQVYWLRYERQTPTHMKRVA